jgi:hypothetical protein
MPYAPYGTQTQNWHNWDYEILVFQPNGSSTVQVRMWQFATQNTTNGPQKVAFPIQFIPQVQIVLNPNCNSTGMQFCLTIDRSLFSGVPTGSATPPPPGNIWYINWIVASPNAPAGSPQGSVLNAPGLGGPNDTTFQFPSAGAGVNVTTGFDQQWFADASWPQAPNPAAQYSGGEVLNNP